MLYTIYYRLTDGEGYRMKLSPILRTVAACALVAPWSYALQANALYSWHTRYNFTLPRLSTRSCIAAGVLLGSLGIGYYCYKAYLQKLSARKINEKQRRFSLQDKRQPHVNRGYLGDSETEDDSLITAQRLYDTDYQAVCLQTFDLLCQATMFLVTAINAIQNANPATVLDQHTTTIKYLRYTYGKYIDFLHKLSPLSYTEKIIAEKIAQNPDLATLPWGIIIAKTADDRAISINLNNQIYTVY